VLKQQVLLGLLKVVDEVFTEAKIPYWITGGSLLGALRHKGFIPHDDDVDLECFEEDLVRIQAAFASSFLPGHFVESGFWEGQRMGRLVFWEAIFIDVFLRPKPLRKEPCFPSDLEVWPLKPYAFHDVELPGPYNAQAFLDRCYGPSWSTEARLWNHDDGAGEELWAKMLKGAPRVPLPVYQASVEATGYRPPSLHGRAAAAALEHLQREDGEVQELLWELLGWASPMPPPSTGVWVVEDE